MFFAEIGPMLDRFFNYQLFVIGHWCIKIGFIQGEAIFRRIFHDFFHGDDFLTENLSLQSFLDDMESEGEIRLKDGASQAIRYMLKPMNLAGDFYQLFTCLYSKTQEISEKSRMKTVSIDSKASIFDFCATEEERVQIMDSGREAVKEFLKNKSIFIKRRNSI